MAFLTRAYGEDESTSMARLSELTAPSKSPETSCILALETQYSASFGSRDTALS